MATPDYLQKKLNKYKLPDEYSQDVNLMIVHYLSGSIKNPYKLRRTKVSVNNLSYLATLAKNENEENEKLTHEQAIKEYIRYLDRENTLLKLIVQTFIEKKERHQCSCLFGNIKVDGNGSSHGMSIESETRNNEHIINWNISPQSAKLIAPLEKTRNFLQEIYTNQPTDNNWEKEFRYLRSELFGKLVSQNREGYSFEDKDKKWNLLSSIQAGLIYFAGAIESNATSRTRKLYSNNYSCSIVVLEPEPSSKTQEHEEENKDNIRNDNIELAVLIVSPSITYHEKSEEDILRIENSLQNSLKENIFDEIFEENERLKIAMSAYHSVLRQKLRLDDFTFTVYRNNVQEKVYFAKENIFTTAADWIILLTNNLIAQKHESHFQDFFLVCGELSEFLDSQKFNFRYLKEERPNQQGNKNKKKVINHLKWPNTDDPKRIINQSEKVTKYIAREHYPWFEKGRHALFWNTATKDNFPVGLLAIQRFNWLQLVQNYSSEELPIQIPNCLIGYVCGNPQETGILIISEGKAQELFRWQENQWKLIVNQNREKELQKLLGNIIEKNNKEDKAKNNRSLNNIIKIALRIAEHPNKGGTIVILENEEANKQFKAMGESWQVDSTTTEDVMALVSQDGATLWPLGTQNMESCKFRSLLVYSKKAFDLLKQLESWFNPDPDKGVEWPLDSKGSRRWSAAITACDPHVHSVLVISQDGDIQLWYIKNNDKYLLKDPDTEIEVYEFPVQGETRTLIIYQYNE